MSEGPPTTIAPCTNIVTVAAPLTSTTWLVANALNRLPQQLGAARARSPLDRRFGESDGAALGRKVIRVIMKGNNLFIAARGKSPEWCPESNLSKIGDDRYSR